MRKTVMITVGLLLGASLLGGCGGDKKDDKGSSASSSSKSDYCDTLKSSKAEIEKFTGDTIPTTDAFNGFIKKIQTLADQAPAAVADDWNELKSALTSLTDALDKYGVTLEQVSTAASTGQLPDGVSLADFQKLGTELQALGNANFDAAAKAIDKDAQDECGLKIAIS